MATILSLETTTDICSVAIHKSKSLLTYFEVHITKSHSEKITLLIEQAIKLSGLSFQELDAIALSKGPGSYTGLRVGASTAKGLCMALDKPLIAINSLKAMALEVSYGLTGEFWLCPMIDARRMEVYCALYDRGLADIVSTNALVLDETSFERHLENKKIIFFGSGAEKFKNVVKEDNAFFIDFKYPQAKFIGELAFNHWDKQIFEDLHRFEPFYLKDFVLTKKSN